LATHTEATITETDMGTPAEIWNRDGASVRVAQMID